MEPKEVDFEFPRGDTCPIEFEVNDMNDVELVNFDEIYFTIKKNENVKEYILQKKLTTGQIERTEKGFALEISHEDTASLSYGNYVYDIQLKSGTYFKTAYKGQITLTKEVTHISNE